MKVQTDRIQESIKNLQNTNASQAKETEKLKNARALSGDAQQAQQSNTQNKDVKTDISSRAVEFAAASKAAHSAPDIRENKVADLKARIQSGSYQVNAEALADKIFEEHLRTNGIGN
jgi:negative regulator of flagellin synthesis FlgM